MQQNHTNNSMTTRKIVLTGLLAAMTVAGSAIRVTMPISIGGTTAFHLGNIMCALAGILLGPWYGGLAAGLGSAIYDMLNPLYISECWITFLTKGAYGLVAGLIAWAAIRVWNTRVRGSYLRAIAGTVAGALTYAVLYLAKSYFYSGMLLGGLSASAALPILVAKLPATIFNAVVAIIGAPLLAMGISRALEKARLNIQ